MKKRIVPIIFALLLVFSLVGCSSEYPYVKISQSALENETKIKVGD